MIARIWRGAVRAGDATAYASYIQQTGIEAYRRPPETAAPGCCGGPTVSRPKSSR
jgi:hypothetical protein